MSHLQFHWAYSLCNVLTHWWRGSWSGLGSDCSQLVTVDWKLDPLPRLVTSYNPIRWRTHQQASPEAVWPPDCRPSGQRDHLGASFFGFTACTKYGQTEQTTTADEEDGESSAFGPIYDAVSIGMELLLLITDKRKGTCWR